jgi:hypothetical protein
MQYHNFQQGLKYSNPFIDQGEARLLEGPNRRIEKFDFLVKSDITPKFNAEINYRINKMHKSIGWNQKNKTVHYLYTGLECKF